MKNINTKTYWNKRFKSGSWNKAGRKQTIHYALGNVLYMDLDKDFAGSILDFGCALGDAIPIFKSAFPNAIFYGIDISDEAIKICKENYGDLATFSSGSHQNVTEKDIIIASHVMEHITDDKKVVRFLIEKCKYIYIIVPYKENPLYHEHVNYYEDDYYDDFEVLKKVKYNVSYKNRLGWKGVLKSILKAKPSMYYPFSKNMILFKIKGKLS
jgi:SAM-dependent methyltransferase